MDEWMYAWIHFQHFKYFERFHNWVLHTMKYFIYVYIYMYIYIYISMLSILWKLTYRYGVIHSAIPVINISCPPTSVQSFGLGGRILLICDWEMRQWYCDGLKWKKWRKKYGSKIQYICDAGLLSWHSNQISIFCPLEHSSGSCTSLTIAWLILMSLLLFSLPAKTFPLGHL